MQASTVEAKVEHIGHLLASRDQQAAQAAASANPFLPGGGVPGGVPAVTPYVIGRLDNEEQP